MKEEGFLPGIKTLLRVLKSKDLETFIFGHDCVADFLVENIHCFASFFVYSGVHLELYKLGRHDYLKRIKDKISENTKNHIFSDL